MAIGFIVALVVLAAVIIYLFQARRWHGPFVNFLIVVLIIVILFSLVFVYMQTPVDFSAPQGFVKFTQAYFAWWGALVKNTGGIVGYAVNQNWGVNSTTAAK